MNSFGNNFLNLGNIKRLGFFACDLPWNLWVEGEGSFPVDTRKQLRASNAFTLVSDSSLSSSHSLSGKYMEHSVSFSVLASDGAQNKIGNVYHADPYRSRTEGEASRVVFLCERGFSR